MLCPCAWPLNLRVPHPFASEGWDAFDSNLCGAHLFTLRHEEQALGIQSDAQRSTYALPHPHVHSALRRGSASAAPTDDGASAPAPEARQKLAQRVSAGYPVHAQRAYLSRCHSRDPLPFVCEFYACTHFGNIV